MPTPDSLPPIDPEDLTDAEGFEEVDATTGGIPLDQREFDLLVAGDLNPDILVLDPDPVPVFGQVEKL